MCTTRVLRQLKAPAAFSFSIFTRSIRAIWNRPVILLEPIYLMKQAYDFAKDTRAAADAKQAVGQVVNTPFRMLAVMQCVPETKNVVLGSLRNSAAAVAWVVAANVLTKPIQENVPYFWVVFYGIAITVAMLNSAPRAVIGAPLYNGSLDPALRKDLYHYIASIVAKNLKEHHGEKLSNELDLMFKKKELEIIDVLFYPVISRAITKILIEVLYNPEFMKLVFGGKPKEAKDQNYEDPNFIAHLLKSFSAEFSIDSLRAHVKAVLDEYLPEVRIQKISEDVFAEIEIKKMFEKIIKAMANLFAQVPTQTFLEEVMHALQNEKTGRRSLMALLPSPHYFSEEKEAIGVKLRKPLQNPLTYFEYELLQGYLSSNLPFLGPILGSFVTGNLLWEQRFALYGMSQAEQSALRAENKMFMSVAGGFMMALYKLGCLGAGYFPGGNSFITSLILYQLLFKLFSVNILLENAPLPGVVPVLEAKDQPAPGLVARLTAKPPVEDWKLGLARQSGYDVYFVFQSRANHLLGLMIETVDPVLMDLAKLLKTSQNAESEFKKYIEDPRFKELLQSREMMQVRVMLLGQLGMVTKLDQALDELVQISVINLFLRLNGRAILEQLENVEAAKQSTLYKVLSKFQRLISFIVGFYSETLPILIEVFGSKNVELSIEIFRNLVIRAERFREGNYVMQVQKLDEQFFAALNLREDHMELKVPEDPASKKMEDDIRAVALHQPVPKVMQEHVEAIVTHDPQLVINAMGEFTDEVEQKSVLVSPVTAEDTFHEVEYDELVDNAVASPSPHRVNSVFPVPPVSATAVIAAAASGQSQSPKPGFPLSG
jgi:hypothetical protein